MSKTFEDCRICSKALELMGVDMMEFILSKVEARELLKDD
jgi:hypothetical protein